MNTHLHIHFIVPAGGVDADGNWVDPKYVKNNFLFPVKALSRVFRGIFIEKLRSARKKRKLSFPGELSFLGDDLNFENWIRKLVAKDWVVYAKKPFDRPERAVAYIGRYTHRIAIANSRILSIDNGIIRFSFKNYKKIKSVKKYKEIWEETELPAMEFIRRFIRHIPPKRYHRIRHFGFLGNGCKKQFRALRERLFRESNIDLPENTGKPEKKRACSVCEKGSMQTILIFDGRGRILKGRIPDLLKYRKVWGKNRLHPPNPDIKDSS